MRPEILFTADPGAVTQELSQLHQTLKNLPLKTILSALVLLAVCIVAVRLLLRLLERVLRRSQVDGALHRFVCSLARIVLYFLTTLLVAATLGIDVTSLVALLSVVSLAVTLSVQGALSNVAGGAMVIVSKPFKKGDYVSVDGLEGTVDEIGMVYTRLHTLDNRSVLLPNAKVAAATIENFSSLGKRRLELVVGASYDSDPRLVLQALHTAVDRTGPLPGEPVVVEFHNFGDSAIEYHVCLWVNAGDYIPARYALRRHVWEAFRAAGVEMTYPHLNVHLDSEQTKPK